jgi:hypothetical protein
VRRAAAALLALVALAPVAACSDDESGDLAAFCAAVGDRARFDDVFDDLDPTDPETARATFAEAREQQEALRDLAPQAARPDIDVLLTFVDDLIDGLEPGSRVDEQGRPSVYQSLRPRFDEVEAAGNRLRVYVETNC